MNLFLALPTYGGQRFNTAALLAMAMHQRRFDEIIAMEIDGSLLACSFNQCLIQALKCHKEGRADFFLLMHADIVPIDMDWLDHLMNARREVKAQVISAVVPIKDQRGVTSTAIEGPSEWAPRRLTMAEIMAMPETFTRPDLLVNTAMLLIDLRKNNWIDKVCFTIKDAILELPDGERRAGVQPEDWDFSRQARAHGATLYATRAVKLVHRGAFSYPNFAAWGSAVDPGDKPAGENP